MGLMKYIGMVDLDIFKTKTKKSRNIDKRISLLSSLLLAVILSIQQIKTKTTIVYILNDIDNNLS